MLMGLLLPSSFSAPSLVIWRLGIWRWGLGAEVGDITGVFVSEHGGILLIEDFLLICTFSI